ncbi:MAG: hypothetical protein ACRERR_00615 [Moraxellaceae bacterium]
MEKMLKILLPSLLLALLTGCGSDDGNGASGNITGVAATGNAISGGTVTLKCAGGLNSATAITNADGSYKFIARNVTLPCLAKVDFTDSNSNPHTLHSYVSAIGTSNISPLTDLLVAALFQAQPADTFSAANFKTFTAAERTAALTAVQTSLQAYGINLPTDLDPIRDSLIAKTDTQNGNDHDQILDAAGLQLTLLGTQQIDLVLQINGTSNTANSSLHLVWGQFKNGNQSIEGFFSNPPQIGGAYIINPPIPTTTLASYMTAHTLAGTYNGTFTQNGGSCSFVVNADASVTSGFILPVAEGSNASTTYLIPASAFIASSRQPANSWLFQDAETQRAGGLGIVNDGKGGQSLSLALLDANVPGPEACLAPLSAL